MPERLRALVATWQGEEREIAGRVYVRWQQDRREHLATLVDGGVRIFAPSVEPGPFAELMSTFDPAAPPTHVDLRWLMLGLPYCQPYGRASPRGRLQLRVLLNGVHYTFELSSTGKAEGWQEPTQMPKALARISAQVGFEAAVQLWGFQPAGNIEWSRGDLEQQVLQYGPFVLLVSTQRRSRGRRITVEATVVDGEPTLIRQFEHGEWGPEDSATSIETYQRALEVLLRSVSIDDVTVDSLAELATHLHLGEMVRTQAEIENLCATYEVQQTRRHGSYMEIVHGLSSKAAGRWRKPERRGTELRFMTHLRSNDWNADANGVFYVEMDLESRIVEVERVCAGKHDFMPDIG